jgi:putative nucleotidyltransferase with HDIG domain
MKHRTQLLLDQVESYYRSGQWSSALDLCEEVFRDSWRRHDADAMLEVVLRLGFLYSSKGDRGEATEHLELALAIAEQHEDDTCAARALNGLGVLHHGLGSLEVAQEYYLQAKRRAHAAGNRLTSGDVQVNLGILSNIRGDLVEALHHYETAFSEYEAVAHESRLARVLNNLGMLYTDLKEYGKAGDALARGLSISRSLGDLTTEGILHTNRTELYLAIGDLVGARLSCDEAFEIASQLSDAALKADVLKCYGLIYREINKPHLAESHLRQAIGLASEIRSPLLEAEASRELGLVLRSQDKNQEALQAFNRAHSLFLSLRAKNDQADIASRLEQLETDFLSLVELWGQSIEAKDHYTSGHCRRVADYACEIAAAAGIGSLELKWFRMGAFLHDVGKTEVPEEILNKPGKLTEEERIIIEKHTIVGDEILSTIEFPWDIRPMVRSHHERWDGGGYPDGLAGAAIPFTARILKVADVFDALTTTRSYRQPLSADEALRLMEADLGSYDPDLFEIFRQIHRTKYARANYEISGGVS